MKLVDQWWSLMARRAQLTSRKRAVEVAVTTDREAYCPGDQVFATVSIEARRPIAIREAVAELVCLGFYFPESLQTSDSRMPVALDQESVTLLGRTQLEADQQQQFNVSFRIPPGAPPTYRGTSMYTQWWVQAGIDAPSLKHLFHRFLELPRHIPWWKRYVSRQLPWYVRLSSGLADGALIQVWRSAEHGAALTFETERAGSAWHIEVALEEDWVAEGGSARGSITVIPEREIDAAQVCVQINRVETLRTSIGKQAERTTGERSVLAEERKLLEGSHERFAFSLAVPVNCQPFLVTPTGEAHHEVEAAVSVRGRRVAMTRVPFFVYNCPGQA